MMALVKDLKVRTVTEQSLSDLLEVKSMGLGHHFA